MSGDADDLVVGLLGGLAEAALELFVESDVRPTSFAGAHEHDDTTPRGVETPPDTWEIGDESAWQAFVDAPAEGAGRDQR